jgi:dipeptidyl aminopeptidase/acylaminoacyl peptidase
LAWHCTIALDYFQAMTNRISAWLTGLLWSLAAGLACAQGSKADYERAARLREATVNTVFKQRVRANWLPGNTNFWYRNDLAGGRREFIWVDAVRGERRLAFDHAKLARALTQAIGKPVQPERVPVDRLDWGPKPDSLLLASQGRWWLLDLHSYTLEPTNRADGLSTSLPATTQPRPTRRTGEETSITFVNRTTAEAVIYWLTETGERRRYATVGPGQRFDQHTYAGHVWLVTDAAGKTLAVFEAVEGGGEAIIDGAATDQPAPPRQARPRRSRSRAPQSPDGQWRVVLRDYNLHLHNLTTDQERALTTDGTAEDGYTEEQVYWAPDSRKLVALKTRKGEGRKIYLIESSPKDQLQPKLHAVDYEKPGDRITVSKPHLFDAVEGREIPISDVLFENPWSITDIRWAPDSREFTFLYNQRGHQVLRVLAVDAATGKVRVVIEERSPTFICYSSKFFCHYLDQTGEIIWMSERDGWNHLYLYDARTGQVKNQITRGPWVVRGVDHVDEAARQIWFRAGGIRPEQDPYYVHYCRVNFDGTGLTILTEGDGTHTVEFSPDRQFLIDTWSRVDLPPVTELRRASDGRLICELERADATALFRTGWRPPERFVAKGRDGQTDIYGIIIRPSNFDPNRKYPVLEDIYAGPQSAYVPKAFRPWHGTMNEVAELGFIVVKIDGMGTSHRSKAFHDVCWKNLGDAGLPDRIAWMKAAAAKYPEMDLSRVGIYGGSAGGQNAVSALLRHGDFYKVAVADCGCHDNRMDKIWWNEQWMGWPVGPEYAEASNVTHAHKLQGRLLLIVGELDRNVDPASTMQLVNALIRADKDFDLLIVPGGGHGIAESPYGRRRRADFFVRHLWGVEPRHEGLTPAPVSNRPTEPATSGAD